MGFKFQGTTVSIGDDNSTVTAIGCLTGFSYTENEPTIIDDTCTDATEFKAFLIGLKDSSTMEIDLSLDHENAGYLEAIAAKAAGELKTFVIDYSDAASTVEQFTGYVMTAGKTGVVDDKFTASLSIRVVGATELNPA